MSVPTPILQYNLSDASVKGLLPSGYTPLAYIESTTAGEYIDTGFKYSSGNITVDCEYTIPSNNDATIFGCSNNNSKWLLLIYRYSNASGHYCGTISGTWGNSEPSGGKRRITYSISGTTCTLNDGKQNVSGSCGTIPALTYSYTLWCHHYNGSFVQKAQNARIYYFRLIYQGNLTLDYRPARRDSDGVIGMYDLVSRTFKTNSGSGTFIAGPELAIGKGGGKSLPEEYLLVEYLESMGALYINTGYNPNNNTRVLTEFMPIGNQSPAGFFGSYQNADWTTNTFGLYYSGTATLAYSNFCSDTPFTRDTYLMHDIKHLVDKNKNILTIDGTTVITHTNTTFQSTAPLYIFALNKNGDNRYSNTRMWYFKIYDNGTISRNMIPCYRKSDMKPGMYDTVTGTFYTNLGSGEFILGPSIINCYTSEPNAGGGTLQGLYVNCNSIYDANKGWVAGFNGSNYIIGPSLTEDNVKTVSFWINPSNLNNQAWFSEHTSKTACGYWTDHLVISCAAKSLACFLKGTLSANNWNHIVIVYSSTPAVYINGLAVNAYGNSDYWTTTASSLIIGGKYNSVLQYGLTGQISNFMIFNTTLTAAQVKELYGK